MLGFHTPERTRKRGPAGKRKRVSHGGMEVRELQIRLDLLVEPLWTRGETLLQPAKSLAGFNLVEQNRFGTWTIDPDATARRYPDPQRALRLFHRLETIRLDACPAREIPGAARELARLRPSSGAVPNCWARAVARLRSAQAGVETSLVLLPGVYPERWEPPTAPYEGVLRPEAVQRARGELIFPPAPEQHAAIATGSSTPQRDQAHRVSPGNPGSPSPQDLSEEKWSRGLYSADGPEAPSEVGPERNPETFAEEPPVRTHSDPLNELPGRDRALYDEWDCTLQRYRKDWCRVRAIDCPAGPGSLVHETLGRHRGLVSQLRRTFEALRREDLRLTRQVFGDDLDLDAVVEAHADTLSGNGPGDGLYVRTEHSGRSVAALILLDMSASTDGLVNRIERESLVLIGEALEDLRDRYAVYGFSSRSRADCTLNRIKSFDEPNAGTVQGNERAIRIGTPQIGETNARIGEYQKRK